MTPNLFIHAPSVDGDTNAVIKAQILDHLPNRVTSMAQADVVIVPIFFRPHFAFDQRLYDIPNKRVVILDFIEFGWDSGDKENRLGLGALKETTFLNTEGYAQFDQWIADRPPDLIFKRELFEKHRTEKLIPIEFLCTVPKGLTATREQFEARRFEVFYAWGLSNPMRQQLHGDIFLGAHDNGYNIVDSFDSAEHLEKRNWMSCYFPWHSRVPLAEILKWQGESKISVSLHGAGRKSFRDAESCINAVMARPADGLAFSYPWTDENSVPLEVGFVYQDGFVYEDLCEAVKFPDLYERYLAGLENCDNYRTRNYIANYIMPMLSKL